MPDYQRRRGKGGDDEEKDKVTVPQSWVEPRCHVCQSKYRRAIDRMIALGTGATEISRVFGGEIDRRSITNHAEKHLAYEDAAVRHIIAKEAEKAQEDMEEGISAAVKRRVFVNTLIEKSMEALISGDIELTTKDALAAIQMADKLDTETEGAALEEMRVQFNAFLQAIREICPPETWQKILDRTKEVLRLSPAAEIAAAPQHDK